MSDIYGIECTLLGVSWGQVYIGALCIDEEKIKIIEGKKETVQ